MGDGTGLILKERVPHGFAAKLDWGPAGIGKPYFSGMQGQVWPVLLFSSPQKMQFITFFSTGFFRTMSNDVSSEDMVCDDVTEEVTKNTILNATMMNIDQDSSSNQSFHTRDEEIDGQED